MKNENTEGEDRKPERVSFDDYLSFAKHPLFTLVSIVCGGIAVVVAVFLYFENHYISCEFKDTFYKELFFQQFDLINGNLTTYYIDKLTEISTRKNTNDIIIIQKELSYLRNSNLMLLDLSKGMMKNRISVLSELHGLATKLDNNDIDKNEFITQLRDLDKRYMVLASKNENDFNNKIKSLKPLEDELLKLRLDMMDKSGEIPMEISQITKELDRIKEKSKKADKLKKLSRWKEMDTEELLDLLE